MRGREKLRKGAAGSPAASNVISHKAVQSCSEHTQHMHTHTHSHLHVFKALTQRFTHPCSCTGTFAHLMLICLHTDSLPPVHTQHTHTCAHVWRPWPAVTERSGWEEGDFFTSPIGPPKDSPFFVSLIWLRSPGISEPVLKITLCEISASLSLMSDISLGVSQANAQSQFYFTIWLPQYGLEHVSESRLTQFKCFLCPLCRPLVGLRDVSGHHSPHL